MKKSLSILLISIGLIVGIVGVLLLLSGDNGGALFVKEIHILFFPEPIIPSCSLAYV